MKEGGRGRRGTERGMNHFVHGHNPRPGFCMANKIPVWSG